MVRPFDEALAGRRLYAETVHARCLGRLPQPRTGTRYLAVRGDADAPKAADAARFSTVEIWPSIQKALSWFDRASSRHGLLTDMPYWHFMDWAGLGRNDQALAINAQLAGAWRAAAKLGSALGCRCPHRPSFSSSSGVPKGTTGGAGVAVTRAGSAAQSKARAARTIRA